MGTRALRSSSFPGLGDGSPGWVACPPRSPSGVLSLLEHRAGESWPLDGALVLFRSNPQVHGRPPCQPGIPESLFSTRLPPSPSAAAGGRARPGPALCWEAAERAAGRTGGEAPAECRECTGCLCPSQPPQGHTRRVPAPAVPSAGCGPSLNLGFLVCTAGLRRRALGARRDGVCKALFCPAPSLCPAPRALVKHFTAF